MNVIVCVKQIPDPALPGELDADNTLKRDGKLILDESDSYGVEMALQLVTAAGGGAVSLVSMAPNEEVSGLRTALAMGADGMNMGTRFIATREAPVHDNVKQAIVGASELDTRLVMRPLRNTERVLNNPAVERLLQKEIDLGAELKFEDIIDEVAGVYPRIMMEGDMDAGAWSCGMVAGLINDIPSVKQLIDGIMSEADSIIKQRLNGLY